MRATRWILISLAFGALPVHADDGDPVCPLSETQQSKAVKAFAELLPIFGEPRCFNCHGGVSPFSPVRGVHPDLDFHVICTNGKNAPCDPGSSEDFNQTFKDCAECHSEITGGEPPRWRLAPAPAMQWNVRGTAQEKPGILLCRQQKNLFALDGPRFIRHMQNDEGKVQFIAAAYAGMRALNDGALNTRDPASPSRFPDPPRSMTRQQMSERATKWVEAMNGGMPDPEECGCIEMQYALRVKVHGIWTPPLPTGFIGFEWNSQDTDAHPALIPLQFHDDGGISGAGMISGTTTGAISGPRLECQEGGNQTLGLTASGSWPALVSSVPAGGSTSSRMQITLQGSPVMNRAQAECNGFPGSSDQAASRAYAFKFLLDPIVGVKQTVPWDFPLPGFTGQMEVTLVRTK